MGDSLTSKAEVQRLPCHDPQPSASPSRKRSKDEQRDWRGKSEGALSSGNTSAHARGGLPGDAKKERGARARPACRPAKFSPTLAYFLTLSPRAGRPPPTPRAKRLRSARSSRPEMASTTQRSGSGKSSPTHGLQDCLASLESPQRGGSLRGCDETAVRFSRLSLTNLPNAWRES